MLLCSWRVSWRWPCGSVDEPLALPGVGLALVAGEGLSRLWAGPTKRRRLTGTIALCTILGLLALTRTYNRVWHDPVTLYTHVLAWEPTSAKMANNFGMAYVDEGKVSEAIVLYRRAIALSDEYPQTHHNLGQAYLSLGDHARALDEFRRAVAMNPAFYQSWIQIGALRLAQHHLPAAAEAFQQAIRAYPYATSAYLGLAQIHLAQGHPQAAQSVIASGLQVQPDNPTLRQSLEALQAPAP